MVTNGASLGDAAQPDDRPTPRPDTNDSSLEATNDDVTLGIAEFTADAAFDDAQNVAELAQIGSLSSAMVAGTSNAAVGELAA